MTTTNNWLGIAAIDFSETEDKQTKDSFELRPQGWYPATIKNAVVGVIGQNNRAALTVYFDLEDGGAEVSESYYLPEGDAEKDVFKQERLRNLFTRVIYSSLTYEEYKELPAAVVNAELKKFQASPTGINKLIGAKVQVNIVQEPFISADKQSGQINFTEIPKSYALAGMPVQVKNLIEKAEKEAGVDYPKLPKILFSNRVSGHGIGFIASYEAKECKNSKAYEWVQSLSSQPTAATESGGVPNY